MKTIFAKRSPSKSDLLTKTTWKGSRRLKVGEFFFVDYCCWASILHRWWLINGQQTYLAKALLELVIRNTRSLSQPQRSWIIHSCQYKAIITTAFGSVTSQSSEFLHSKIRSMSGTFVLYRLSILQAARVIIVTNQLLVWLSHCSICWTCLEHIQYHMGALDLSPSRHGTYMVRWCSCLHVRALCTRVHVCASVQRTAYVTWSATESK